MHDMTARQALAEAQRRWGESGAIHERPQPSTIRPGTRGRLARYRYTVGNFDLGARCTVQGMGDTWRAAFDDARARA